MDPVSFTKSWLVQMCISLFGQMSPEEKKTLEILEAEQRLQEKKFLEGIKALQK